MVKLRHINLCVIVSTYIGICLILAHSLSHWHIRSKFDDWEYTHYTGIYVSEINNGLKAPPRQVLSFDSLRPRMRNAVHHDYSFSDYGKRMKTNDKTDLQVGRLQLPSEASSVKLTVDRLQNCVQ